MALPLTERLAGLTRLQGIPLKELQWLETHGRFAVYKVGTVIGPKGIKVANLWIILSGKIAIRVDRGAGPRLVAEWRSGEVSGMLPYSRMSGPPGDNYVEEEAELIAVDVKLFPRMIRECPQFTAYTVHCMLDRTRNFNTSDLQDEKMISLGKLASGLAHELNNPASATVRDAKLLLRGLADTDSAWQKLLEARLSDEQLKAIMDMRNSCLIRYRESTLSPIQKADLQDKLSPWLTEHQMDSSYAAQLADSSVSIDILDELTGQIGTKLLDVVISWIIISCGTQALAAEMQRAAGQIYTLVDAIKKFTYMDNLSEKELVDIEPGIRNTLMVLASKAQSKNAEIHIEFEADLAQVYANGSDLNQVWFSLLDNALDAISNSGKIHIDVRSELNRVVARITDNGPGIAAEALSKIFDPFYTTKPPGHGTGLGLDITRRLLRRYAGDIIVQSQPGKTEFRVILYTAKPGPY